MLWYDVIIDAPCFIRDDAHIYKAMEPPMESESFHIVPTSYKILRPGCGHQNR